MERKFNSIPKLKLKKGDTVKVISGAEKGKTGIIVEVFPAESRVTVEGVNIVSRHTKPNTKNPNGGIIKKEAPLHISNLMLVVSGTATRVGRKTNPDGKLQRYAKKTGDFIK